MDPVLNNGMVYAVIGAVVWGYFLFLYKYQFDRVPSTVFMTFMFVSPAAWYMLVAEVKGMPVTLPARHSSTDWLFVLSTIAFLAAGLLILFHSIKIGQVSYVAPISKITPTCSSVRNRSAQRVIDVCSDIWRRTGTLAVYVANYQGGKLTMSVLKATTYRPAQLALLSAFVLAILNVAQ
ncbi:hypothetical protein ACFFQF_32100 [Haladaptatus pallidirubidus]|uniref:EamA family transporter n=1 Tax=Haladaptatus pallidirubidus TaxID=1008152 RepID=UPI001D0FE035|nr:hypothetical protein [Haladaptatus pallidirubidus]